jgi:hypothetical protein
MQASRAIVSKLDVLLADGPSPELGDAAALYAPVMGSWDVEVVDYDVDGSKQTSAGEWHFWWALEGRAVQDVFIVPRRNERTAPTPSAKANRYGTTIRFYDRTSGEWMITWINPVTGAVNRLAARREGNAIVQVGTDPDGTLRRWSFVDITRDAFHWTGEESSDGGRTWFTSAEFFATRSLDSERGDR